MENKKLTITEQLLALIKQLTVDEPVAPNSIQDVVFERLTGEHDLAYDKADEIAALIFELTSALVDDSFDQDKPYL